jgi:hypothetical protein
MSNAERILNMLDAVGPLSALRITLRLVSRNQIPEYRVDEFHADILTILDALVSAGRIRKNGNTYSL